MKTLLPVLALLIAVQPAMARGLCVMQRDIVSTRSDDGRLLIVKLRDGRTLVNHLHGICTDLRYEALIWNVPGTGEICEDQQSFTVRNSGQSCTLGKFDPATATPKLAP